ncbi:MAG: MotA/TolQ/ExbB proton channel family protein [Desulfurispora sp.]|uniref:MotA/TolQ/ExbB proton channel family protein n=1 Tax=Desulfurispora sp. TaxID=3014275 RepID=UPI00404A9ED4
MPIPGSQYLSQALHLVAQSLLLPVIAFLLLFVAYAVLELGGFIAEMAQHRRIKAAEIEELLAVLSNSKGQGISAAIAASKLTGRQKELLEQIAACRCSGAARRALARRLLEEEELACVKQVEKTDLVARLGPALGLMGTLIPLGPGLAALGAGNVEGLAEAVIIAFDTTVAGLAAGGLAYLISTVRRRWYEGHIGVLEAVTEPLLEVLENVEKKKPLVQLKRSGGH